MVASIDIAISLYKFIPMVLRSQAIYQIVVALYYY